MGRAIFYSVVNFQSAHWLMADAKITKSLGAAREEAKKLARKYPHHEYHILQAIECVRAADMPVELIKIDERSGDLPSGLQENIRRDYEWNGPTDQEIQDHLDLE